MTHRYPRRLLPKKGFYLIDSDILRSKMKDFFLLRIILRDDNEPDVKKRLKNQFIPSTFKKGISVVLHSVFQKEDVGWRCKKPIGKKYENKWEDSNWKAIIPKNNHLYYDKKNTFGGFKIEDLNNYDVIYSEKIKDENGNIKKDKHGNPIFRDDHIRLRVVHEPVCINFWHCEIFLYRINGEDRTEVGFSNSEMERAGNLIIDDLTNMAYPCEETAQLHLLKKYYKKGGILK